MVAHDRLCKVSNELGLHLPRDRKACQAIKVLLNAERNSNGDEAFDAQRRVPHPKVPSGLIDHVMTKATNFCDAMDREIDFENGTRIIRFKDFDEQVKGVLKELAANAGTLTE